VRATRSFASIVSLVAVAVVAAVGLPTAGEAAASAWSDHQVVASRLIAGAPRVDGEPRLGLHVRLAPEWHVYWKHPGDAGAPPQVSIAAGAANAGSEAVDAEVLYPAPQRFRLPGGLEALGYQREVVYPLRTADAPAPGGQIAASVDYVACAVECIPYHDELTLDLPTAPGATAAEEEELLREWEARLPRPPEEVSARWRLRYRAGDAPEIELELIAPQSQPPASSAGEARGSATDAGREPELFLEPAPGATFASPERIADAEVVRFRAAVRPEVAGRAPERLRVAWTVTGLRARGAAVALAAVATVPAGGLVGADGDGSGARSAAASRPDEPGRHHVPRGANVALLALVPLLAALMLWLLPERLRLPGVALSALRAAGFVAAAALVWIAYRLGALLPAARVAAVELSWLAVALAVQGAAATTAVARRRLWMAVALVAAAAGVWAAWPPAMLSP
jgi:DsbC/DsbD-like thiol-disulfide interchange protein